MSVMAISSKCFSVCCLPIPCVLTHKFANGNTLAAIVMAIDLLYKYSGSQQGPSPRFSSEQYAVCVVVVDETDKIVVVLCYY